MRGTQGRQGSSENIGRSKTKSRSSSPLTCVLSLGGGEFEEASLRTGEEAKIRENQEQRQDQDQHQHQSRWIARSSRAMTNVWSRA